MEGQAGDQKARREKQVNGQDLAIPEPGAGGGAENRRPHHAKIHHRLEALGRRRRA